MRSFYENFKTYIGNAWLSWKARVKLRNAEAYQTEYIISVDISETNVIIDAARKYSTTLIYVSYGTSRILMAKGA